ncbi:hypothetical protein [Cellulophaga baltica]|uniref:hypothetical protein n=1 Tax=Cellulophaga baltica TaxID=76594 RepID=UPI000417193D|nr:hypothetical protein [Cellulophaga baltica]AIY12734.1 hypothetical protein M667_05660 [Cellulophaga baltica NN016038]
MKNLEKFEVHEMSQQEIITIDGGGFLDSAIWAVSHVLAIDARLTKAVAAGYEAGANAVVGAHNRMYH